MILSRENEEIKFEIQIAPLIDVVFLLLIYFMVTASLIKKEGDISFMLPANVEQYEMITLPIEVLIEINQDNVVESSGMRFQDTDREMNNLVYQINGLRQIAASQGAPFSVNILPHEDATHWRIIDVMDACAAAGVDNLSFSKSKK